MDSRTESTDTRSIPTRIGTRLAMFSNRSEGPGGDLYTGAVSHVASEHNADLGPRVSGRPRPDRWIGADRRGRLCLWLVGMVAVLCGLGCSSGVRAQGASQTGR